MTESTFVRKSAWSNHGTFDNDDLCWYAIGVGSLMQRRIDDPTSWKFLAAIHGFNRAAWTALGQLTADDRQNMPARSVQARFWKQCQHSSWYFLPWHRGYLTALEAIVRDAVVKAGGPPTWALPYWDYSDTSNPDAAQIPPAFTVQTTPDGTPNPLFVQERYGASMPKPTLPLPADDINLTAAMRTTIFTGIFTGGDPGFGGPNTGFWHGGSGSQSPGQLEMMPHNYVHGDVGGELQHTSPGMDPQGLMSSPDTAGLDPIFYLHHANIDRLWEEWLHQQGAARENPTDAAWLDGPVSGRKFVMPMPDGTPGGTTWHYTPQDVINTQAAPMHYQYDKITDPGFGIQPAIARLAKLGATPAVAAAAASQFSLNAKKEQNAPELIGANGARVSVQGASTTTQVQLDKQTMNKVTGSFAALASAAPGEAQEPDRVYLNLEGVRSNMDSPIIEVYINLPEGADPAAHHENYAGAVSLFGVSQASRSDQAHGGNGVNFVLDITNMIDALHLSGDLAALSSLNVRLVPRNPLNAKANVSVERISVYRQKA